MADKQYGGWYWRPELGKALRWWGEGIWTEGDEPNKGGSTSSTRTTSSTSDQYFLSAQDVAKGANLVTTKIEPFNFDYEQAELDALEKLRPYYEELLARAQGDLTRAQGYLTEDYNRGLRYRAEDFDTATQQLAQAYETGKTYREQDTRNALGRMMSSYEQNKAWDEQDLRTALANFDVLEPREQQQLQEAMNKRDMLSSSVNVKETGYLTGQQDTRRQAVERAMQRKRDLADVGYTQNVADTTISSNRAAEQASTQYGQTQAGYEKTLSRGNEQAGSAYQRAITEGTIETQRAIEDLEEQKKKEALGMVEMQRGRESDRYALERGSFLE